MTDNRANEPETESQRQIRYPETDKHTGPWFQPGSDLTSLCDLGGNSLTSLSIFSLCAMRALDYDL